MMVYMDDSIIITDNNKNNNILKDVKKDSDKDFRMHIQESIKEDKDLLEIRWNKEDELKK